MENIESILTMAIVGIIAFIILKFVFRLFMSLVILSLTMGVLYYDYNYNYLNDRDSSYIVKYIDEHVFDIDGLEINETVSKYKKDYDTLNSARKISN